MIEQGSNPPPVVLREEILHVPGSRPSHRIAVMPGNYPQCHVYARRDPSRGEEIALFDDVKVVDHIDSREQSSHLLLDPPVSRGTFTVQQSSFAQE
jgi:hypothetical protein